jgi:hypothetical protein
MDKSEPPSPQQSSAALFLIGRDSHGNWVAQDQDGLRGGLFVTRSEALKFALFENGNRRQSVIMVPGPVELDMTHKTVSQPHDGFRRREAA